MICVVMLPHHHVLLLCRQESRPGERVKAPPIRGVLT